MTDVASSSSLTIRTIQPSRTSTRSPPSKCGMRVSDAPYSGSGDTNIASQVTTYMEPAISKVMDVVSVTAECRSTEEIRWVTQRLFFMTIACLKIHMVSTGL